MHISIAHSLAHNILNTLILIGRRNEPHPPLNCGMGGDLRVLFSCILHHCMNRVMVSLKIVSLSICLEKSFPRQGSLVRALRLIIYGQQSFRVENHNSSSEIGFSGHICFCSFVWELIEIRVKPLLWALSWGQTNTYPDKVNLFNMNWLQFMMLRTQWTLRWTMNHLPNLFLLNMPHDQKNLT